MVVVVRRNGQSSARAQLPPCLGPEPPFSPADPCLVAEREAASGVVCSSKEPAFPAVTEGQAVTGEGLASAHRLVTFLSLCPKGKRHTWAVPRC